jgi:RHH-type proline utilization regulon transcriptional repressor/proline dehydrogenase/delta 1-pyrroline-5-carboxylate dehydrogenase
VPESELETLTRRIGKELFARVERPALLPLGPAWWDDRLMEWSMGDEAIKVQLFRFVDVLPLLRTPGDVARHLREYFGEADGRLPPWMKLGLHWLPERGGLGGALATTARRSAERLARKFIAGSNIQEALAAVARMRKRSLAFTIDLLGEATVTEKEADEAQAEYLEIIDGLSATVNAWPENALIDRDDHGPLPRVNVSVKLSALYSQFDAIDPEGSSRAVRERLRPILRAGKASVRQHRHGAIRGQGPHDSDLSTSAGRGGVPRLAGRRHRHSGVPPGLQGRPGEPAGVGGAARDAGVGAAGQGRLLGL